MKKKKNLQSYNEVLPASLFLGTSLLARHSRTILWRNHKVLSPLPAFQSPEQPSMRFEDILQMVGGFSRYQLLTLCIVCLPKGILPLHFLLHNFVSATPPHRCAVPEVTAWPLEVSPPPLQDGAMGSCMAYNGSERCTEGWTYDRSQFTSTTATEVDLPSVPACSPSSEGHWSFLHRLYIYMNEWVWFEHVA